MCHYIQYNNYSILEAILTLVSVLAILYGNSYSVNFVQICQPETFEIDRAERKSSLSLLDHTMIMIPVNLSL